MKKAWKTLILGNLLFAAVLAGAAVDGLKAELKAEEALRTERQMAELSSGTLSGDRMLLQADAVVLSEPGQQGIQTIQIGTGTVTSAHLPIEPFWGYTYSQVIYLPSEIGRAGSITEIRYQYNGFENFTDSVTVYMGLTDKDGFLGLSDWVPVSEMTQVYTGLFSVSNSAGWYSISLDTPFSYDNSYSLVVAVDENRSDYHGSESEFLCTGVSGVRGLSFYSDDINPDPLSPPEADIFSGNIANITLLMDDGGSGGGAVTESEPNDSFDTADPLALTESFSGSLGLDGDSEDWISIVLPKDGSLSVFSSSSQDLNLHPELYDSDGSRYLSGCDVCGSYGSPDTLVHGNLKAGSYYLRTSAYGSGTYSLGLLFQPATLAEGNDAEPNDSWAEALMMTPNSLNTGHLGYFGDGETDLEDRYVIQLPSDGSLEIALQSDASLNTHVELYDADSLTYITGCSQCGSYGEEDTLFVGNLRAGTYFVKLSCYGYGSYSAVNSYIPATYESPDELEPNHFWRLAQLLDLNSGITGHIGFSGQGSFDDRDLFAVTLPYDGVLTLALESEQAGNGHLDLYGSDTLTFISGCTDCGSYGETDTLRIQNLKAGSYFLKITSYGYTPYFLNTDFTAARYFENDELEPNNSSAAAQPLLAKEEKRGTIGYRDHLSTDSEDWYKILTGAGDSLLLSVRPDQSLNSHIELYDSDGGSYLSGSTYTGGYGVTDSLEYVSVNGGVLYVKITAYGYGSYLLKSGGGVTDPVIEPSGGWKAVSSGTFNTLEKVHFPTESVGYAVGWNKTVLKTTDGGLTWASVMNSENWRYLYDVQFLDELTGFICGDWGMVYKTADGGETWTDISLASDSRVNFSLLFKDAQTGIVSGGGGYRSMTTDGGLTWVDLPKGYDNIKDTSPLDGNTLFQVGYARIYSSSDGGQTWADAQTLNSGDYLKSLTFRDAQNGIAVGYNYDLSPDEGFMFTTQDGGQTWTRGQVMVDNSFIDLTFVNPDLGFLASNIKFGDKVIYKTVDGGLNWIADTSLTTELMGIATAGDQAVIAVGKDGLILRHALPSGPPAELLADFSAEPVSGTAPLMVNFTSMSTGDIVTHEWDFDNDGTVDDDNPSPSYTYTDPGSYTVRLKVYDADGNWDEILKEGFITVNGDLPPADESLWTWLLPNTDGRSIDEVRWADASTVYAAGYDGLLMKSSDAGMSWQVLKSGTDRDLFALSVPNAATAYAAGSGIFLASTDGGASWTERAPSLGFYTPNDIYFTDVNNGFAMGSSSKLYRTSDGGNSWAQVTLSVSSATLNRMLELPGGELVIAGGTSSGSLILKSSDGGTTWTEKASGGSYAFKDADVSSSGVIYAVGSYGMVMKSSDAGETWAATEGSMFSTVYDVEVLDDLTAVLSCDNGVFQRTVDGGLNWTEVFDDGNFSGYTMDFHGDTGFSMGWKGHIMQSHDGGLTWEYANSSGVESLYALSATDFHNIWAAGESGMVFHSMDAGHTWSRTQLGGDYDYLRDIFQAGPDLVIVSGAYGKFYKSTDGGLNWETIQTPASKHLRCLESPAEDMLYAGALDGQVVKTVDGGLTWVSVNLPDAVDVYDLKFFDPQEGYAFGGEYNSSSLYHTTDGGQTWTSISVPVAERLNCFQPLADGVGLIGTDDAHILRTTDNGLTWTDLGTFGLGSINTFAFLDSDSGFFAGDYGKIYSTSDAGLTWTQISDGPDDFYYYDAAVIYDQIYFAGMGGQVLRYGPEFTGPPLMADFEADVTEGAAPLTVQFSSLSTGDIVTHEWDFNNDGSMDEDNPNPTYTFSAPGVYTVSLKVIGSDGTEDIMSRVDYITVTDTPLPLLADFKADLRRGKAPLTVQFTDLSQGQVNTRSWDFGDGMQSSDKDPLHTYQQPGAYTVSLSLSNTEENSTEIREGYVIVTAEQPIALKKGWNWFSMNLDPMSPRPDSVLASLAGNGVMLKSQTRFASYSSTGNAWVGELDTLHRAQMFMLKMNHDDSLFVEGLPLPDAEPIAVDSGWNWIGYTKGTAADLNAALGTAPSPALFIKSQFGFAWYYPDYGWYGSLTELQPGQGYKIVTDTAGSISYSTGTKSTQIRVAGLIPELKADEYSVEVHRYEGSMSVVGRLTLPYGLSPEEGMKVLALSGEELRGAAILHRSPFDAELLFTMTVYGDGEDLLDLRIVDGDRELGTVTSALDFRPDALLGNALDPHPVILLVTGLDENYLPAEYSLRQNYPNPFNPVTRIEYGLPEAADVNISIYSITGQKVTDLVKGSQNAGWHSLLWDARNSSGQKMSTGIYICRITAAGAESSFVKVIKMAYLK